MKRAAVLRKKVAITGSTRMIGAVNRRVFKIIACALLIGIAEVGRSMIEVAIEGNPNDIPARVVQCLMRGLSQTSADVAAIAPVCIAPAPQAETTVGTPEKFIPLLLPVSIFNPPKA
jgi:hypothetical protein